MRRTTFRCFLLTIVASLCLVPAFAGDWPRFLGPNGDGKSNETGLDLSWPETGPPLVWEVEVGDGYTMPAMERTNARL